MKKTLQKNRTLFVVWAITAAFGAYFCTYAFRKPFATGTFSGLWVGEMEYKAVAIIAQVIGYMLSKFIGVRIISELKPKRRVTFIIFLILASLFSLALFGVCPAPYNAFFMFLNGLPLGMVWGVLFSFLEGRRFTELLGMGLSLNMIVTSGVLKSFYLLFQERFGYSDFEMPLVIGCIFLPLFLVFVAMLAQLPPPSKAEKEAKMPRKAMSRLEKRFIWLNYFPAIFLVIIIYAFLTTLRDFRDNFSIEIWRDLGALTDPGVFAATESTIGLAVICIIGLLILIKDNQKAFSAILLTILFSFGGIWLFTACFSKGWVSAFQWMVGEGVAFYLPYLLIQIAFFERMIPVLRVKANAGYFVYLCDSTGYLGSVLLLIYKEFFARELNYAELLIRFSHATALAGVILTVFMILFFRYSIAATGKKTLKLV